MDRTLRITIGILITGLIGFGAVTGWTLFVSSAYQTSLSGSYSYSLTVSTDARLSNVTFFIPVPEDKGGNSPIIAQYSSHGITGIPDDWTTTLFSTGKTQS